MRGLQCRRTCSPSPVGGLFLDPAGVPSSFAACIPAPCRGGSSVDLGGNCFFLSISLKSEGRDGVAKEGLLGRDGEVDEGRAFRKRGARPAAVNTTKHLWAGAVAAMVSRTFVAPLERLKLEYIVRGEKKNLLELIQTIAASQGLKSFWRGNFVNILRTAPFKAVHFCSYDTYRKQLLKVSGNEETTNFERFIAGAAAGITATVLCIPMDTIRTVLVAPGGEAMGGITGAFRHLIQSEGFISLYKGLVPSILSVAPSGAIFYGVYDILKSGYLHSPEGQLRSKNQRKGQELNALDKLELGPMRTLVYGALSGACAEAATYPLEVVRRRLQLQAQANKMNALTTFVKIVDEGGVPALYAGLLPSLLQVHPTVQSFGGSGDTINRQFFITNRKGKTVLPSAAISYFVYEFMKIVLKVE